MNSNNLLPAFAVNNTPIVISANNLYAPYAGVMIKSILNHANADRNYDIIIFEREISKENKQLLAQLCQERRNISIRFLDMLQFLGHVDLSCMERRFPLEACCGLFAPYFLTEFEKLIAVDVDILLRQDIAELLDIDMTDFCIGGVQEIMVEGAYRSNTAFDISGGKRMQDYFRDTVPLKDPLKYINSGMLVLNCGKCREAVCLKTIFDVAQSRTFVFPDQDLINLLFEDKIKFIDMAWNVLVASNLRNQFRLRAASEESISAYEAAFQNPALLHWIGKLKPWVCPDVLYGNEWWNVAMETPFIGHIIARMMDAQIKRREYYEKKYGEKIAAWDPILGNIRRDFN